MDKQLDTNRSSFGADDNETVNNSNSGGLRDLNEKLTSSSSGNTKTNFDNGYIPPTMQRYPVATKQDESQQYQYNSNGSGSGINGTATSNGSGSRSRNGSNASGSGSGLGGGGIVRREPNGRRMDIINESYLMR